MTYFTDSFSFALSVYICLLKDMLPKRNARDQETNCICKVCMITCISFIPSNAFNKTTIPDKIRNATRRTDQLSGRSQVMGQFCLYRCKGMSGTAALHIVCNQASKMCTRILAKNQVGVKL